MIELRKPIENMTDCDKIIRAFSRLQLENTDIRVMPKGEGSIRASTNTSVVHVVSPQYSFSLSFTKKKMRIQEFPYGIIPTRIFLTEDIIGADVSDTTVTFYLTDGAKYNLKSNTFTIDFRDMSKSTSEIVDGEGVRKSTPFIVEVA